VFCNHVTIVPPVRALLDSPDLRLDAFIGPGHVSTVIGCRPYEFMPEDYGKPCVVAGFEPLDLLQSILMLMRQLDEGRCEVENQYGRVVLWEGNLQALKSMAEVFELRPYFEWRGSALSPSRRSSSRRRTRTSTPSCATRRRACGWRTPRPASAARS
jgi:hydrogenase expression/formation protein HypD